MLDTRCTVFAGVLCLTGSLLLAGTALSQDLTDAQKERIAEQKGPLFDQVRDILSRVDQGTCSCPNPFQDDLPLGIVWRGDRPIGLHEIATIAAPVMWFSLDEPLILSGEGPLPNPHPCDPQEASGAVVYYAPHILQLHHDQPPVTRPEQDDPDFFDKVHGYAIRYYFYYVRDVGTEGHTHDLELAEFHFVNEATPDGCYQVRLTQVIALAHGVDWYNNIMDIRRDVRLPVTIFVEEGKHASCPDRNGDGIYTPGYDVTTHVNDAWGVRDVLGQGLLQGAAFKASMTKKRDPAMRMLPPETPERCPSLPSRAMADDEHLGHYEIRPANMIEMCDEVTDHPEFLAEMMKRHGFGRDQLPNQYPEDSVTDKLKAKVNSPASIIPSFSLRWDQSFGFSFLLNGLDMHEFWLVPKFNFTERLIGMQIMGTPSASRWADWYFALGADRFASQEGIVDGQEVTVQDARWNIAAELGYKFRFRAPAKIRPFLLGYHFGGLRFGVAFDGFDNLEAARFVTEIGAGVW
jgi:hypothetical protein